MRVRTVRVVPADHGWALQFEGFDEEPQLFASLEAAIAAGWTRARRERADLHIHRHDGELRLRMPCLDDAADAER